MIDSDKDFALCNMADELLALTSEKVQQRYQGWRQRVMRAGCRNVVFEMGRHFTLLLHKAGYGTRTTKKGVEILAKTD